MATENKKTSQLARLDPVTGFEDLTTARNHGNKKVSIQQIADFTLSVVQQAIQAAVDLAALAVAAANGAAAAATAAAEEAVTATTVEPIYITAISRLVTSADNNKELIVRNGSGCVLTHADPADYPVGLRVFWTVDSEFPGMITFRDHLGGTTLLRNEIGAFTSAHSGSTGYSKVVYNADLSGKLWKIMGGVA